MRKIIPVAMVLLGFTACAHNQEIVNEAPLVNNSIMEAAYNPKPLDKKVVAAFLEDIKTAHYAPTKKYWYPGFVSQDVIFNARGYNSQLETYVQFTHNSVDKSLTTVIQSLPYVSEALLILDDPIDGSPDLVYKLVQNKENGTIDTLVYHPYAESTSLRKQIDRDYKIALSTSLKY